MVLRRYLAGAAIPPLDDTVVRMTLVTPGKGTLELSEDSDPETFRMARCGVGALVGRGHERRARVQRAWVQRGWAQRAWVQRAGVQERRVQGASSLCFLISTLVT